MTQLRTFRFGPGIRIAAALMDLGKRVGLAKPILRVALARMFSPAIKRRAFAGYVPDERDVFVATFGKSGTNRMMQIAVQISHRGRAEFDHIHDLVPWPDSPLPLPLGLEDRTMCQASPAGVRIIKTHLETAFVPYHEKATYLTVIRDPKEVLVSAYHFLGGLLGMLEYVSPGDWLELALGKGSLADAWAVHSASYWAWRERANVLVLPYGDLEKEPSRCVEQVAARMRVALSEEEIALVAERASFDSMRAHESQFAPPTSPFQSRGTTVRMIRSGRTGGSDEILTRAQQAAIDRRCRERLRRLGSDLPYDEIFDAVG